MMNIKCSVSDCKFNNGYGECDKDNIFISDAETGEPVCQDYEEGDFVY